MNDMTEDEEGRLQILVSKRNVYYEKAKEIVQTLKDLEREYHNVIGSVSAYNDMINEETKRLELKYMKENEIQDYEVVEEENIEGDMK